MDWVIVTVMKEWVKWLNSKGIIFSFRLKIKIKRYNSVIIKNEWREKQITKIRNSVLSIGGKIWEK